MSSQREKSHLLICLILLMIFVLFYPSNALKAETFVWQDFEYWDSPRNHGWICSSPSYPVWGGYPFVGYGNLKTDIDYQLQSRVLKLDSMPSAFNQFYTFFAWNQSVVYPTGDPINDKPIISFNIRMFMGIEWFDQWEVQIYLMTRNNKEVNLIYRPVGEKEASGPEFYGGRPGDIFFGQADPPGYVYELGRQYQDGTWHLVVRDLDRDVDLADDGERNYSDGFGPDFLGLINEDSRIASIMLKGYQLQVDNIAFHKSVDMIINHPPKLQRIGPQYAEIFVPFTHIITAEDIDILTAGTSSDQKLEFYATVGGYGASGVQTSGMLNRIMLDANDNYVICDRNDPNCIPNKILLQFVPQYFEDLIITIRVMDEGGLSDIETFPLSVVNYPITNHPPYFEEIENDVYVLGTNDGYFVKEFICYDKDAEDDPGTVEVAGNITYSALVDGFSSYQYGPWQEPIIPVPCKPEIRFSPKFEGVHTIQVVARDSRGLSAITQFNLIVVDSGTWLNHPPILCEDIDSPQIAIAGKTFVLPVEFFDPDGDFIYYSCNIGSITEMKEGFGITEDSEIGQTTGSEKYGRYVSGALYTMTTHWPGRYLIEIIAYDIRGGYAIQEFILDVQPWWTY